MAHVMVGRCISKTKFHELLGSWTLDFNCGGYYDGALSAILASRGGGGHARAKKKTHCRLSARARGFTFCVYVD